MNMRHSNPRRCVGGVEGVVLAELKEPGQEKNVLVTRGHGSFAYLKGKYVSKQGRKGIKAEGQIFGENEPTSLAEVRDLARRPERGNWREKGELVVESLEWQWEPTESF